MEKWPFWVGRYQIGFGEAVESTRAGKYKGIAVCIFVSLIASCGPSFESVSGLPLQLRATELNRVTIRQLLPSESPTSAASRCAGPEELRIDDGVKRITMSGCDSEGTPQMETFRLAPSNQKRLLGQFESLPLKRLTRQATQVCPESQGSGFELLVVVKKSGQELLFAPASLSLNGSPDCARPLAVDGVFDDDGLGDIVQSLHKFSGRKS